MLGYNVAFDAMRVFKEMGISVPENVWKCGFERSGDMFQLLEQPGLGLDISF